jgi:hypothetical protein
MAMTTIRPETLMSSALAFDTSKLGQWGSLSLDDLAPIIAKSARLQQEIRQVLSEGNKKQEDVTCLGMRRNSPNDGRAYLRSNTSLLASVRSTNCPRI